MAQQTDAELWTGISVEKELADDLSLGVEEQLRLNNNYSHVNGVLTDISLGYRFNKYFRLKATYRYGINPEFLQTTEKGHRFNIDGTGRYKAKPFVLHLRTRYQIGYNTRFEDDFDPNPAEVLRFKLYNKFDLDKDYVPYFGTEFFFPLNEVQYQGMDGFRLFAGVEYELNDFSELKGFFMLEKELNRPNPTTASIIGVGYAVLLDKISF